MVLGFTLHFCCNFLSSEQIEKFQEPINICDGIQDSQALSMAKNLQFEGDRLQKAAEQIKKLYKLFINVDATQVEINPLGETPTGDGKSVS